jgi:hypothetical protein
MMYASLSCTCKYIFTYIRTISLPSYLTLASLLLLSHFRPANKAAPWSEQLCCLIVLFLLLSVIAWAVAGSFFELF